MFSLQRLFGNPNQLYELVEAAAAEVHRTTGLLATGLAKPGEPHLGRDLQKLHHNVGHLCAEIRKQLALQTPPELGKDDFEALTQVLFKISKTTAKFADRLAISSHHLRGMNFTAHGVLLNRASGIVVAMVRELRRLRDLPALRQTNEQLQAAAHEEDALMKQSLGTILGGAEPPLRTLAILDLHALAEKGMDRCMDAGDLVIQIALKHA